MKRDKAYRKIIDHFGSSTALARMLLISDASVRSWKLEGDYRTIPPWRAMQIEIASQGEIKAEDLNPEAADLREWMDRYAKMKRSD